MSTPVTAPGFFVSKSSGLFVGRLFSEPDKGVPVATPCYAHIILHKELIIIRFDSEVICIYASPNRFFCSTWRAFSRSPAPRLRAKSRATPCAVD